MGEAHVAARLSWLVCEHVKGEPRPPSTPQPRGPRGALGRPMPSAVPERREASGSIPVSVVCADHLVRILAAQVHPWSSHLDSLCLSFLTVGRS